MCKVVCTNLLVGFSCLWYLFQELPSTDSTLRIIKEPVGKQLQEGADESKLNHRPILRARRNQNEIIDPHQNALKADELHEEEKQGEMAGEDNDGLEKVVICRSA